VRRPMPVRVGAGRERAAIGYGLMRLTGDGVWGPPPNWHDALALLREAYDRGVRVMDSAWYYGPHVTHQLLAEALHPYPDDLVIVTKVGNSRTPERGWAPATSRRRGPDTGRSSVERIQPRQPSGRGSAPVLRVARYRLPAVPPLAGRPRAALGAGADRGAGAGRDAGSAGHRLALRAVTPIVVPIPGTSSRTHCVTTSLHSCSRCRRTSSRPSRLRSAPAAPADRCPHVRSLVLTLSSR
jgi:hypothetical protein